MRLMLPNEATPIDRLTDAVEWVIREHQFSRRFEPGADPIHNQGSWGQVKIDPDLDTEEPVLDPEHQSRRFQPVSCTTSCCVAGHATIAAGAKFVVPVEDHRSYEGSVMEATYCRTADGQVKMISTYGQELLGLDQDQADALFGGSNDAYEIVGIAHRIATEQYGMDALPVEEDLRSSYDDLLDEYRSIYGTG